MILNTNLKSQNNTETLNKKKVISILGSTGSIGTQSLDVIRLNPELFELEGITTNKNIKLLLEQVKEFNPNKVAIFDEYSYLDFLKIKDSSSDKSLINL